MDQDRETLGQFLKRERELHLVPVEEMALSAGVKKSLIDALEGDDFDAFSNHSQIVWLIKYYAAYLNLNQKEVSKRFGLQWKLYGGVKRFPKLSHFTDGEPSLTKPGWLKGKGIPLGGVPKRRLRFSLVVMVLIVVFILLIYLPALKQDITPPEPSPRSETEQVTTLPESNARLPEADTGRKDPSKKTVPAPNAFPARPVAEKKTSSQPKSVKVIGNRDSKRYHLPGMKYYERIMAYHRVVFRSEGEAVNAGYRKARE